jgi:hypothetical protein
MTLLLRAVLSAVACACLASAAGAEAVSPEQFRQELSGTPLCGVPASGPLQGKALCTVYSSNGTTVVAGAGFALRGLWDMEGNRICRRGPEEPFENRRCISYERIGPDRFRNSDGVEVCLGPCP